MLCFLLLLRACFLAPLLTQAPPVLEMSPESVLASPPPPLGRRRPGPLRARTGRSPMLGALKDRAPRPVPPARSPSAAARSRRGWSGPAEFLCAVSPTQTDDMSRFMLRERFLFETLRPPTRCARSGCLLSTMQVAGVCGFHDLHGNIFLKRVGAVLRLRRYDSNAYFRISCLLVKCMNDIQQPIRKLRKKLREWEHTGDTHSTDRLPACPAAFEQQPCSLRARACRLGMRSAAGAHTHRS